MELSIDSIPFVASAMAQNEIMTKVGVGMLEKTLDVASEEMSGLTKAMELSVNPNIGANIDVMA